MSNTFLESRIAATEKAIVAYENALVAIVDNGVQSYTLDTGQTSSTVTKLNVSSMQKTLNSLYNTYSTLNLRLNGGGVTIARPGF